MQTVDFLIFDPVRMGAKPRKSETRDAYVLKIWQAIPGKVPHSFGWSGMRLHRNQTRVRSDSNLADTFNMKNNNARNLV